MNGILLGQQQAYESQYNPDLLQQIPRARARSALSLGQFAGVDVWTCYELSWLDTAGKPQVAIAEFCFVCGSEFLIESKSFKYYLNSLNQTAYARWSDVVAVLKKDLAASSGAPVEVTLFSLDAYSANRQTVQALGVCIDDAPITCELSYTPTPQLLAPQASSAGEASSANSNTVYVSHLLKSNCPVTGQPDWASLWVGMSGAVCSPQSLLAYVISFREHQDFHENCVERIFSDISEQVKPSSLWVYARYTRRGGLDINPFRSSEPMTPPRVFSARQ